MSYLLAGQLSELDRLRLQSRVWEPAGKNLLQRLPAPPGARALDVGCGAMGWLRVLDEWVGEGGSVLGTDIDEKMLTAGAGFIEDERLGRTRVVRDDLFASALEPGSFDLVHARFQIAPLGRAEEQIAAYRQLVRDGALLVLEDPDSASWRFNPPAPAAERLIELILKAFRAAGGDFDAGREEFHLLRQAELRPGLDAQVVALEPGHPYLRLPLQFASSLRPRLVALPDAPELDQLLAEAESELGDPGRWGTTFTLVQTWATVPA